MTPMRDSLAVGMASDVGRVRDHNEDAAQHRGDIFVLADGMGGHQAGEVASAIAVDTMLSVADRSPLQVRDIITAVEHANKAILSSAARHPEQTGMGTTLAGLAIVQMGGTEHWAVFNIGDSRVYRYLDETLTQVTVDHSEVWEMVAEGRITSEQARTHPGRNIITRSLGREPMGAVDTWVFPPYPGERFIVCSDGLSDELSMAAIEQILRDHADPQEAAQVLVDTAVRAGGRDNATALVVVLPGRDEEADVDETTLPRMAPIEQVAQAGQWSNPQ